MEKTLRTTCSVGYGASKDKPISIWGWANPGEKVTVSFAGQTQSDKAHIGINERMWKITLSP